MKGLEKEIQLTTAIYKIALRTMIMMESLMPLTKN